MTGDEPAQKEPPVQPFMPQGSVTERFHITAIWVEPKLLARVATNELPLWSDWVEAREEPGDAPEAYFPRPEKTPWLKDFPTGRVAINTRHLAEVAKFLEKHCAVAVIETMGPGPATAPLRILGFEEGWHDDPEAQPIIVVAIAPMDQAKP